MTARLIFTATVAPTRFTETQTSQRLGVNRHRRFFNASLLLCRFARAVVTSSPARIRSVQLVVRSSPTRMTRCVDLLTLISSSFKVLVCSVTSEHHIE